MTAAGLILHPLLAPSDTAVGRPPRHAPFGAHLELLHLFLSHRGQIVDAIQEQLNAHRKPAEYRQDGDLLFRLFEDCFFTIASLSVDQQRLRGQLEAAHWADGFKPRDIPGLHNGLIDPAELMVRAFHLWEQTRWPGRGGRVRFAHTLFDVYLVRCLALSSMRVWDEGRGEAGERLSQVQAVLDRVWKTSPAGGPVLVRNVRWLIQLAQSPATDDLGAYFQVAERIAGTFSAEDRIQIHAAGVRLTAGHLRSQTYHYSTKKGVALDDTGLLLLTRSSNALDFALLMQDLVPLFDAYGAAVQRGDDRTRLDLADAICQGISPDPELFLNRTALLGAYSMIEHLFVADDQERARYTPMGERHVGLWRAYEERLDRITQPLFEDLPRVRPVPGTCSPYGVLYGFSSDLIEHVVLKAAHTDVAAPFSLEDVFVGHDASAAKRAWVNGWRQLPHIPLEVQGRFAYPEPFADRIFNRMEDALRARVAGGASRPMGRLVPALASEDAALPELAARYIRSSDREWVAAGRAESRDEAHILADRREGRALLTYRTPGGWVAVSKDVLTDLAAGQDVKLTDLPPSVADVLALLLGVRS